MNKKLLVLLLLVTFFFTACAKPTQEMDNAKATVEALTKEGAIYAKDELKKLNDDLTAALDEVNVQGKKFFKNYGKAKEMLAKVNKDAEALKPVIAQRKEETEKKLKNPNFLNWISKKKNYDLSELKEEDEYVYNSINIKKWSALYDEWDKIEEPYLIEQIAYNQIGSYDEKILKNSQGIVAKKLIGHSRYNPMQITAEGLVYSDHTAIHFIDFTGEFEGVETVSRERMWLCLDKRGNIIKKDGKPILLKPFHAKQKTSFEISYNGSFISKKVTKIYPCENCSSVSGIKYLRFVW